MHAQHSPAAGALAQHAALVKHVPPGPCRPAALGHACVLGGVTGQAILDEGQHDLELGVGGAGGVGQGAVLGIGSLSLHTLCTAQNHTQHMHREVNKVRLDRAIDRANDCE